MIILVLIILLINLFFNFKIHLNLDIIGGVDSDVMESFSGTDSLAIAEKLSITSKDLSEDQILSLSLKIPNTATLDKITSIASEVSLQIFDNTNTSSLANLVEKIKLETLDDSKKSYIGISVI